MCQMVHTAAGGTRIPCFCYIPTVEEKRESPRLVAVIPVYNEEETLAEVFDDVDRHVDMMIVVEDGSRDGTLARIRSWMSGREGIYLLRHRRNMGMARALQTGFLFAEKLREDGILDGGDIVINLDADGQHPVGEIPGAVRRVIDGDLDVLLVDRDFFLYPRYKVLGNRFLTALARLVSGFPYKDVESGFRFLRVRCLKLVLEYYTGWRYSCAQEIAIITAMHGLRIRNDYPISINYYRPGTTVADGFAVLTMSLWTWLRIRLGLRGSEEKNRRLLEETALESPEVRGG